MGVLEREGESYGTLRLHDTFLEQPDGASALSSSIMLHTHTQLPRPDLITSLMSMST